MSTTNVIHQDDFTNTAVTSFLDKKFPLRTGTHNDVVTYLVYFDHLMAIKTDGSTTSLVTPSQFKDADSSLDGPTTISLHADETHVQIHLQACQNSAGTQHPCIDKVYVETVLSA